MLSAFRASFMPFFFGAARKLIAEHFLRREMNTSTTSSYISAMSAMLSQYRKTISIKHLKLHKSIFVSNIDYVVFVRGPLLHFYHGHRWYGICHWLIMAHIHGHKSFKNILNNLSVANIVHPQQWGIVTYLPLPLQSDSSSLRKTFAMLYRSSVRLCGSLIKNPIVS